MNLLEKVTTVKVKSHIDIHASCEEIWPFLCNASMSLPRKPLLFKSGILPIPLACRTEDGSITEGGDRQCITNRGVVYQRIIEAVPPTKLQIERLDDTVGLWKTIKSINDLITLHEINEGTRLTRRSTIVVKPSMLWCAPGIYIGMRQMHIWAGNNFKYLAEGRRI